MAEQINMKRVNAEFVKAAKKYDASLATQPGKKLDPQTTAMAVKAMDTVTANFAGIPGTDSIDAALLTFCTAWPRVRVMLNYGLKLASWFGYAKEAAIAKAWIEAVNGFLPELCEAPKP